MKNKKLGAILAVGLPSAYLCLRWAMKIRSLGAYDLLSDYPALLPMGICMAILSVGGLIAGLVFLTRREKIAYHRLWFIVAPVIAILYLFILPPLSGPDEFTHYVSAYHYSGTILGEQTTTEDGYVLVPKLEMLALTSSYPTANEYQYTWENLFGADEGWEIIPADRKVNQTLPLSYLPQTIGITLARLFHCNYTGRLVLGRLFNLLFAIPLLGLALYWMPEAGKLILFSFLLLPTTLQSFASLSYDAWILTFLSLFLAYCLKLVWEKDAIEKKDIAILAVLIGMLAPCKIVYTPIVGLCLLIPREKFGTKKKWFLSAACVLGAVVFMMLLVNGKTLLSYFTADVSENYVGWAGEQGYTLTYFLSNPAKLIAILATSLRMFFAEWVINCLGWRVGWNDPTLQMPGILMGALILLLIASAIPCAREEKKLFTLGGRIWGFVLVLAMGFLVIWSMLVAWTPISSEVVTGVQGRYFLPIVPLAILLILPDLGLTWKNDHKKLITGLWLFWECLYLAAIFGQVCLAGVV